MAIISLPLLENEKTINTIFEKKPCKNLVFTIPKEKLVDKEVLIFEFESMVDDKDVVRQAIANIMVRQINSNKETKGIGLI